MSKDICLMDVNRVHRAVMSVLFLEERTINFWLIPSLYIKQQSQCGKVGKNQILGGRGPNCNIWVILPLPCELMNVFSTFGYTGFHSLSPSCSGFSGVKTLSMESVLPNFMVMHICCTFLSCFLLTLLVL